MESDKTINEANQKFQAAVDHFEGELKKLRTGRAHASMLDGVVVEAYGVQMPLNQVATVTAAEAQMIQVSPFDPTNLQAIANAIRNTSSLGLNPTDDGRLIRVPIPSLTEERRRDLAKQIGQKMEETMITMRTTRHDALRSAEQMKKDKQISEDDFKRLQKQLDDSISKQHQHLEQLSRAKEQEIMTV